MSDTHSAVKVHGLCHDIIGMARTPSLIEHCSVVKTLNDGSLLTENSR